MPAGRPRASSRETIEEAAGELFLERGYAATSLADIAQRAGVGRATLFGYVTAKSDLLWLEVDAALDDLDQRLAAGTPFDEALAAAVDGCRVPLAVGQVEAMGVADELAESGMRRTRRLERIIAGADPAHDLAARVRHRALAAAISVGWEAWALAGVGRRSLRAYIGDARAALDHR
ncbi:TetR family transcriptional regulator [Pseudolysinimonas sp.]|uniref:TetR/AcrR family transcriptional regulator n=1 Tax=Pseudolysinimonas sp. TaxID=2680009 RepID=UPI003F7FCFD1